jgi:transposase InsO family protein
MPRIHCSFTSLPAERVVRTLQQLTAWRGLPRAIRLDNGLELTAQRFTIWCAVKGIELRHIQPGKPNQNAFIERFNRSYRTEVLDSWLFGSFGVRPKYPPFISRIRQLFCPPGAVKFAAV